MIIIFGFGGAEEEKKKVRKKSKKGLVIIVHGTFLAKQYQRVILSYPTNRIATKSHQHTLHCHGL